jgi:hypothetical protein
MADYTTVNDTISIYFTLHGERGDDEMEIKKVGDGKAMITQYDVLDKTKSKITIHLHNLRIYIEYLIDTLKFDSKPYQSVQFNFPGYPSFEYAIERLHGTELKKAIGFMALTVSESWK